MITVYWLIAAAVLLIFEMITISLTSIWFAGGAIAAAMISLFFENIIIQIVIFIIVSVILLILTRPVALKFVNSRVEKTNADALVGKRCKVAETIDPDQETGKIKINGVEWMARSEDEVSVISEGTEVVIKKISGVKLIVEPLNKPEEEIHEVENDSKDMESEPETVQEEEKGDE